MHGEVDRQDLVFQVSNPVCLRISRHLCPCGTPAAIIRPLTRRDLFSSRCTRTVQKRRSRCASADNLTHLAAQFEYSRGPVNEELTAGILGLCSITPRLRDESPRGADTPKSGSECGGFLCAKVGTVSYNKVNEHVTKVFGDTDGLRGRLGRLCSAERGDKFLHLV